MPTHSETKTLPYTAQQMYDLVADVGSYPQFLPWCAAARIRSRDDKGDHEIMAADLVISFKVFRERFGSQVVLWPAQRRIETQYLDGPFKHMKSHWVFRDPMPEDAAQGRSGATPIPAPIPAPTSAPGCEVEFFVDFEFRNAVLQGIIGVVFNEAMQRIVRAFETRAADLYGDT